MSDQVVCPTCGTITVLDGVDRNAEAFCRVCDYPLFWTQAAGFGSGEGGREGDPGLRRFPGTVGLASVLMLPCWNCQEPNPINGVTCIRCGVDLHPAPVVVPLPPPPPPEPEPEPPPPPPPLWPWAWIPAQVLAVVLLVFSLVAGLVVLLH